jgi:hypothetical protein
MNPVRCEDLTDSSTKRRHSSCLRLVQEIVSVGPAMANVERNLVLSKIYGRRSIMTFEVETKGDYCVYGTYYLACKVSEHASMGSGIVQTRSSAIHSLYRITIVIF